MRKRVSVLTRVALGTALLFLAACGEDEVDTTSGALPTVTATATALPTATPTVVAGEARVRVIHGSPDAPAVDVLVDDAVVLSNVPYLAASDYLPVPAGTHNVKVRATGTDVVVIDADLTLAADTDYTVMASDLLASITPLVLVDDRELPGDGQVKVRIIHGAPSAPTVDIYVTAPDGPLDTPTLTDVPFQGVSDYLVIPSGDYRVRVTAANSTDVAIDTGSITLGSNIVGTAIAVDAPGGGAPFSIEVYADR